MRNCFGGAYVYNGCVFFAHFFFPVLFPFLIIDAHYVRPRFSKFAKRRAALPLARFA
nr:MAG TPA: hypothetical protein [Inoviridae sp.]